jgi:hypothetical protein
MIDDLRFRLEQSNKQYNAQTAKLERVREMTQWACDHCADAPCSQCDAQSTCLYFQILNDESEM